MYYIDIKVIRGILLLEKKLQKASLKTMALTIKKSKGVFFGVLVALLIPIIFISSYTFYAQYSTFALDYSAFEAINVDNENILTLLNGDNLNNFLLATEKALSSYQPNESSTIVALNAINFVLKILIIAFAAVFAIFMERDEKTDATTLIITAVKRIFGLLFVSIFFIWVYQQAQRTFLSLALTVLILQKIVGTALFSIPSIIITIALITFLAALVLVHLYFTIITICKKRTRALFALSYSRSIIKGKKQIFKLLPCVFASFSIPVLICSISPFIVAYNTFVAVGAFAFGEALFIVLTMLAIIYIEPRHTAFEIESNILKKLQQAQMEAFKAAGINFEKNFSSKENQKTENNDSDKEDISEDNKEKDDV